MNIEQMLRGVIECKTAKILKEEYGTELSKEFADKMHRESYKIVVDGAKTEKR